MHNNTFPSHIFLDFILFHLFMGHQVFTLFSAVQCKAVKAGSYSVLFLELHKLYTKYTRKNKNVLLSCRVSNQRTWLYRILPSARYAKIFNQNMYQNSIFLKQLKGKYHRINLNFQAQAVWALHPFVPHLQLGGAASQPQPATVGVHCTVRKYSFRFLVSCVDNTRLPYTLHYSIRNHRGLKLEYYKSIPT